MGEESLSIKRRLWQSVRRMSLKCLKAFHPVYGRSLSYQLLVQHVCAQRLHSWFLRFPPQSSDPFQPRKEPRLLLQHLAWHQKYQITCQPWYCHQALTNENTTFSSNLFVWNLFSPQVWNERHLAILSDSHWHFPCVMVFIIWPSFRLCQHTSLQSRIILVLGYSANSLGMFFMTNSGNGKGKSPGSSPERKFIRVMQIHKTRLVLVPNLSERLSTNNPTFNHNKTRTNSWR